MAKGFSFKLTVDEAAVAETFRRKYKPIAHAGQTAIATAGTEVKVKGRADIGAAGFSTKWQNALRVDIFPKPPKESANAAAFIHHNIPYATIFEDGGTIRGHPLLWIPLKNAPQKIGRERTTPRLYQERIGKLVEIKGRHGPLLGARVRLTASQARQKRPKVSRAALMRGTKGAGKLATIPLFFGKASVTLRKRFNIRSIVKTARENLATIFFANLKDN